MESYLEKSEKVGVDELEVSLLRPEDRISVATLAELALGEGGYHRCVVVDTRRGTGVAGAARFVEQARSQCECFEEEMNRTPEPRPRKCVLIS